MRIEFTASRDRVYARQFREFVGRRTAPPPPKEDAVVTEAATSRLRPPAPGGR